MLVTTGDYNSIFGHTAGDELVEGVENSLFGQGAGTGLTSGDYVDIRNRATVLGIDTTVVQTGDSSQYPAVPVFGQEYYTNEDLVDEEMKVLSCSMNE